MMMLVLLLTDLSIVGFLGCTVNITLSPLIMCSRKEHTHKHIHFRPLPRHGQCAHILGLKRQTQKSSPVPTTKWVFHIFNGYVAEKVELLFRDIYAMMKDILAARQDRPSAEFKICLSWVHQYLLLFSCPYFQINNKACGTVIIPLQATKDSELVRRLVLQSPLGQKLLAGCFIKRAILSPRTALINFLIDEWCLHCLVQYWLSLPGVFLWDKLSHIAWMS